MTSRTVELSENASIVFQLITKHKCISASEMSYWTTGDKRWGAILSRPLTESDIEQAIPSLVSNRLITVSGGSPRRYTVHLSTIAKEEDSVGIWENPDAEYEAEANTQLETFSA